MNIWEYQITRYKVQDFIKEENPEASFYCDQKGQCFLHDTSKATADMICESFNDEGKKGWELVQFGYHRDEVICIWKRLVTK